MQRFGMAMHAEERGCSTQLELADLYSRRNSPLCDYRQAHHWYKNAAKNGSLRAQHRLATLYARGAGVDQDYTRAYAWCKVAVFQHCRCARRKLDIIEARMNFQQLRIGRWLAQDYYDRYVSHRLK